MSRLQHWWIWRDGWVEIEPGDIFAMNDDETCYVLDEGEDPMDVIGAILLTPSAEDQA